MVFTSLHRPSVPDADERYPALRIVLLLWKVLVVLLAGSVMFAIARIWTTPELVRYKLPLSLLVLLIGFLGCVMLWALAQLVEVILDIEENTRHSADKI